MAGNSVSISELEALRQYAVSFSRMGENYICAELRLDGPISKDDIPIQLNGLTLVFNIEGKIALNVNTKHVELTGNQLTVIPPNSTIVRDRNGSAGFHTLMIFLSVDFIHNLNIDLSIVSKTIHHTDEIPVMTLDSKNLKMLKGYYNMLDVNAENTAEAPDSILNRNIARSLTSSLVYYLMQLATSQYAELNDEHIRSAGPRRSAYLRGFIQLVQEHYRSERTVGFYARKLFISPKYLSALIKETTGRSAADWIDQCVILEAKNLLRFSGMTVQQVAYALNFNNQSAFGKYFKHLTGMSPSAFQKG